MTFKERLQEIEFAEKHSAEWKQEPAENDADAPTPVQSEPEQGTPVRCSECGHNTLREEHNAIMCTICCHGPYCNYCWEKHIRKFHPLMVDAYEDARRGGHKKARFFHPDLIRQMAKPAGIVLAALLLVAGAYYFFADRGSDPPREPAAQALAPTIAAVANPASAGSPDPIGAPPPASVQQAPPVDAAPAAPSAPAGSLAVELKSVTSPIKRQSEASLRIQTAAAASCNIEVRYSSGPSKARDLQPQIADAAGLITWTWRIGGQTKPGTWPITVSCTLGGQKESLSSAIAIIE